MFFTSIYIPLQVHVCHVMPGFWAEVEVRCGSCRRWDGGGGRSELGRTLRWTAGVVVGGAVLGRVKYCMTGETVKVLVKVKVMNFITWNPGARAASVEWNSWAPLWYDRHHGASLVSL